MKKLSRSQKVYLEMRRDIAKTEFPIGTTLIEEDLCKRYQASRTPIRESLARLEQEGFLEKIGRQLCIRDFNFKDVQELYHMREALEKMAVRLCIENATDLEIGDIKLEIAKCNDLNHEKDNEIFLRLANDFHRSIAYLCRNKVIEDALISINDKVRLISSTHALRSHSFKEGQAQHAHILKAIMDRDVTVAEAAVREHIQDSIRIYRRKSKHFNASR